RLWLASAGPPDRDQSPAPLLQRGPARAREPHMGEELERKSILPVGVAEREEVAALGRAGIVDQDVQSAEFAAGGLDQRFGRISLAQVEGHDGGLGALAANRRGHLLQR